LTILGKNTEYVSRTIDSTFALPLGRLSISLQSKPVLSRDSENSPVISKSSSPVLVAHSSASQPLGRLDEVPPYLDFSVILLRVDAPILVVAIIVVTESGIRFSTVRVGFDCIVNGLFVSLIYAFSEGRSVT